MAGDRGAEPTGPVLVPGGASFPNVKPSAGPSLTPATTAPSSSSVLTPGPERDASAASLAFRSAPILPRRVRTEAAACPCAGATSAPNGAADGATGATGAESPPPPASPSGSHSLAPAATAVISLVDLTPGATSCAAS